MSLQAVSWVSIILIFLSAVVGYLLGGVNWAIILTRIYQRKDIRDQGSGNAGMTNVLRSVGKLPALLTFVGDFLKCVVAVLISQLIVHGGCLLLLDVSPVGEVLRFARFAAGAACVVGHIFPLYYGFKGGKGVLAAISGIFVLDWRIACILLGIFIVLVAITKYVSLGSIAASASFFAAAGLMGYFLCHDPSWIVNTIIAAFSGALIIFRHSANIGRLLAHNEKKLGERAS